MARVIDCPRCATPNAEGARFCSNCGASLVARVDVQERRVVTALFADLARSTSLGEQLDPEIVRGIVGDFFELARAEIERRGGSVEKFSGDAVVATFGLPQSHEDDPERAVRAAIAIRDGVAGIATDMHERHGVAVQARIGIEAGNVVVGDPFGGATMATGDAMNIAARLEQLAEPGQIVVGAAAWDHVRGLVSAEPLGELALRGREQTVAGWRVDSIASEVGRPRGVPGLQAPLTGRDEELALLLDAARRSQRERKAILFTVLGVPGVGKSRLVREATQRLAQEGWTVVRGRCLPYGDGITYWPVAEMLRELGRIDSDALPEEARARLQTISPDPEVAGRLATALGSRDQTAATLEATHREIAWGLRRLVEHLAAGGPQALVFEDIHWADPALLDLIEYLVTWVRDAPLLVICPSRPELLDARPAWGAGRMESARIQLEPLTEAESGQLLGALLTVEDLPAALRERVLARAEGNPLFVEEVVRMLIDEGIVERHEGRWRAREEAALVRVPDSVEALIRARLDTLPSTERAVLQAAAVVGRVFQRSAVVALAPAPGNGPIEAHLENAVLRDLITEERTPDERTFRFRHVLIRDVAYTTLPKARRAELHRSVAAWLRAWAGERIDEFIEIEAYHLEQTSLLRREIDGRADPTDSRRAAEALAASAHKALARDDARATRAFSERGLALDPGPGETRLELEWLRLESLRQLGEWRRAGELGARLEQEAAALGRIDIQGRAIFAKAGDIWISLESADAATALSELQRARELLTAAGDNWYLTFALEFLGYGGWWHGDLEGAEEKWIEMREVAASTGLPSREAEALVLLARVAGQLGDVDSWRQLLSEAREVAERGPSRLTRARVQRALGSFLSLSESEEEAELLLRSAAMALEEFGDREELYVALAYLGDIEGRRDHPAGALETYRNALESVREHVGYRPEAERRIAQALLALGEIEEAARVAEQAAATVGEGDVATVASTGMVVGLVREAQGRPDEAEQLLREAVEVIGRSAYNPWDQELSLAEFLLRQNRTEEAGDWLARARASAARYGPRSPLLHHIERRGQEAAETGTAGQPAGQSG
jgi:class 3 adenylate cyclase/tetratricopeptide (TPR) repeat protein